jgi:hypothetical protein
VRLVCVSFGVYHGNGAHTPHPESKGGKSHDDGAAGPAAAANVHPGVQRAWRHSGPERPLSAPRRARRPDRISRRRSCTSRTGTGTGGACSRARSDCAVPCIHHAVHSVCCAQHGGSVGEERGTVWCAAAPARCARRHARGPHSALRLEWYRPLPCLPHLHQPLRHLGRWRPSLALQPLRCKCCEDSPFPFSLTDSVCF